MANDQVYTLKKEKNVILLNIIGVHDVDSVRAMSNDINAVTAKMREPVDMLVKVSGVGRPRREALVESIKLMKSNDSLRHIAAYSESGTSRSRILAVKGFLKATGSNDKFKMFGNETDARIWLAEA